MILCRSPAHPEREGGAKRPGESEILFSFQDVLWFTISSRREEGNNVWERTQHGFHRNSGRPHVHHVILFTCSGGRSIQILYLSKRSSILLELNHETLNKPGVSELKTFRVHVSETQRNLIIRT